MKRQTITVFFSLALSVLVGQSNYSKEIEEQIKQVENNLYSRVLINGKGDNIIGRMKHFNVKGLSVAVINNYKVVWAKGYGWANEKEKRPVTKETLFKPGSISKSLNAVGVLKLAQDKKLDLNTDINNYLTSWKFPYDTISHGKKITLANILSHTGGLSVYGGWTGYGRKDKIPTLPEVLDGKLPANSPPVRSLFEPGLKFEYSGGGIVISQLIITDVTHQSYEKFMYDNILKPMEMPNSFFSTLPPSGVQMKKIAMGYDKDGKETDEVNRIYPEQAPLGLWTTPSELCNYIIETQLAYEGRSSKVLNQQSSKLHLTPFIDANAAMGTFVQERNGVKYFFHDAANWGYYGMYIASLEGGNGVVIFTNSDPTEIGLEVMNSVANVYNWKGFDKPTVINTVKIPESIAKKYVGIYLFDGVFSEVTNTQDGLYFWSGGRNCKMHFTTEKDFINVEFPTEKGFIVDNSGKVKGYTRKMNGKEMPSAYKVSSIDTLKTDMNNINMFAWHLLETKRYDEAMQYLNRALTLEPNNTDATRYLAHVYLLKNEFEKGIKIYKEYLSKKVADPSSLMQMLKWDFDFFRKNGFDKILIEKASAELKL